MRLFDPVRAPESERFKDYVSPAWEIYGHFGKSHAVFRHDRCGSIPDNEVGQEMKRLTKLGKTVWIRLIWVRNQPH